MKIFIFTTKKILCILHGQVFVMKTDMTSPEAEITTDESVTKMLEVIPKLGEQHSGKLFEYTGREMP